MSSICAYYGFNVHGCTLYVDALHIQYMSGLQYVCIVHLCIYCMCIVSIMYMVYYVLIVLQRELHGHECFIVLKCIMRVLIHMTIKFITLFFQSSVTAPV